MRLALPISLAALATSGCASIAPAPITELAVQSCAERLSGEALELSVTGRTADGRDVPLTLMMPATAGQYPMIAFSHGAFASPTRYRAMLEPIAAAGYIVIAPMHVDSEEFDRDDKPSRDETWLTRNEDFELSLNPPAEVLAELSGAGFQVDTTRVIAMGHSYGALIAQLAGGALAVEPDGGSISRTDDSIDAVVGWSPPGPMPGFMKPEGWNTLADPSLTITGTADVMPGFIDDWTVHKASFDNAPAGARELWVGEGIDHYFGGIFGREKPASDNDKVLFARAMATTLEFMDRLSDAPSVCTLSPMIAGETRERG